MKRVVAAMMIFAAAGSASAQCSPDEVEIVFGQARALFSTEIADEPAEQARGLMFREEMPPFHSMLFVFDKPKTANFWMKNTPLPLDIIFAGADGTVRVIARDTTPYSETQIPGGRDVQFVLEVHAGTTEMLGIEPGAVLRHPLIDPTIAAAPCP